MVRGTKALLFLWICILPTVAASQRGPEGSLSLAEAIRIVLRESPLSQVADAGVAAAEDGRKSARGEFLPKLRTEFDYTHLNKVPEFPLPEGLDPTGSPVEVQAGDTEQLLVQTTLEQPLFAGLGLLTQYRIARLDKHQADLKREVTRQGLILGTYEAYYGVLLAEKILEVAELAVTQLQSQAEVARQFFENGMTAKNEYLKVLVQLADTQRSRIVATNELDFSRSRLRTLLRWDAQEPLRLREQLVYRPYERSIDECVEIAYRYHPEIMLAGLEVDKANQGIAGARSGLFPRISLVGALRHEEGGFTEADEVLSATIHAEWLIWEWGSTYYEVKQRQSQLLQARARKTEKTDTVELEVREAYLTLQGSKEAIEVARVGIEQAEENYRITEEQYKENITTSTEVLDAQTLLSQAQVNYYSALSSYNIAIARLEKAMGVLKEPGSEGDGEATLRE